MGCGYAALESTLYHLAGHVYFVRVHDAVFVAAVQVRSAQRRNQEPGFFISVLSDLMHV